MQRWSMSSTVSEIIIKLSNMKRLIIFVLTTVTLVAQFEHNTAHRLKYLQVSAIVDSMNTYRYHIADRLFEKHRKTHSNRGGYLLKLSNHCAQFVFALL